MAGFDGLFGFFYKVSSNRYDSPSRGGGPYHYLHFCFHIFKQLQKLPKSLIFGQILEIALCEVATKATR